MKQEMTQRRTKKPNGSSETGKKRVWLFGTGQIIKQKLLLFHCANEEAKALNAQR